MDDALIMAFVLFVVQLGMFDYCSLANCHIILLVPLLSLDKLIDLENDYLAADEATRKFLEQRYGQRVIQKALEEKGSKEWLHRNSKACPSCDTPIQVISG